MTRAVSGIVIVLLAAAALPAAAEVSAGEAFDKLKALAGDWRGTAEGEGEEAAAAAEAAMEVHHRFRVSAAGTVVMETMGPDSPHEMINMYHLDGDELVLTHYCAAGNQPTMRLDRAASAADRLVFDFTGGTNLDPTVDQHIHSAEIRLLEDEKVTSVWSSWAGGERAGLMTFHLARGD